MFFHSVLLPPGAAQPRTLSPEHYIILQIISNCPLETGQNSGAIYSISIPWLSSGQDFIRFAGGSSIAQGY
jgi:hypothetical protein